MIDGIQVSGINVGDTDLSVTLRRQITSSSTTTTATNTRNSGNNMSLPVTVIAAKLSITNLTQLISTVEATSSLAMATSSANPMDAATGQIGSNAAIQGNALSMGFLGLGNRIAASAPSDFVLVVVVPYQGETDIPTLRLG